MTKTRKPLPGEEAMKKIGLFVEPPAPPAPPIYVGPPLPVDIPVDKPAPSPKRGLYHDIFGDDLTMIQLSLDASWSNPDQKRLAASLLSGRKKINNLSTAEVGLLDSLTRQFNDRGPDESVRQAERDRLSVPRHEEEHAREEAEGDEDMQSGEETDLPAGDNPYHPGGYGWLGDGGSEGGGK